MVSLDDPAWMASTASEIVMDESRTTVALGNVTELRAIGETTLRIGLEYSMGGDLRHEVHTGVLIEGEEFR